MESSEVVETPDCSKFSDGFFDCHSLAACFSFEGFSGYCGFDTCVLATCFSNFVSFDYYLFVSDFDCLFFHFFHIFVAKRIIYLV